MDWVIQTHLQEKHIQTLQDERDKNERDKNERGTNERDKGKRDTTEREKDERDQERECILKGQVPSVSMRPPTKVCTDANDLLRCSATVGNLGEMGEPDILT